MHLYILLRTLSGEYNATLWNGNRRRSATRFALLFRICNVIIHTLYLCTQPASNLPPHPMEQQCPRNNAATNDMQRERSVCSSIVALLVQLLQTSEWIAALPPSRMNEFVKSQSQPASESKYKQSLSTSIKQIEMRWSRGGCKRCSLGLVCVYFAIGMDFRKSPTNQVKVRWF